MLGHHQSGLKFRPGVNNHEYSIQNQPNSYLLSYLIQAQIQWEVCRGGGAKGRHHFQPYIKHKVFIDTSVGADLNIDLKSTYAYECT